MPLAPVNIRVPTTQHKTSRKMVLYVMSEDDLFPLALVKSFTRSFSLEVQKEFEISAQPTGRPVEIRAGNVRDLTIRIRKGELFSKTLESELGLGSAMLIEQGGNYELHEIIERPDQTLMAFIYSGCWLTDAGEDVPSEGSRIIIRDATFQCKDIAYKEKYNL